MIAWVGDAISVATGKPFDLTSSRYRRMASDYPVAMEKTFIHQLSTAFSRVKSDGYRVAWFC